MEPKKARDWNFSCEESVLLLDLVLKYKDIVENKCMTAIIRNEKRNAWRNITEEFNASAEHKRSVRALKLKYETMKKFLKKKFVHYENCNLEFLAFKFNPLKKTASPIIFQTIVMYFMNECKKHC